MISFLKFMNLYYSNVLSKYQEWIQNKESQINKRNMKWTKLKLRNANLKLENKKTQLIIEQRENDIRILNIKISEINRWIFQAKQKKKQAKEEELRQVATIQEQKQMRLNFNTFMLKKKHGGLTQRRNIKKLQYIDEEKSKWYRKVEGWKWWSQILWIWKYK